MHFTETLMSRSIPPESQDSMSGAGKPVLRRKLHTGETIPSRKVRSSPWELLPGGVSPGDCVKEKVDSIDWWYGEVARRMVHACRHLL